MWRHCPECWRKQTWLLHHDNSPSHTSVFTQLFLVKHKMAVIPHPLYSPDLVPCDFLLFPKMKLKLKGRWFCTIEEIQADSPRVLDTLTENDFQEAFQKWRRLWDQCLHAGGNYFEGDGGRQALMVSFTIFTASVRNILDRPSYVQWLLLEWCWTFIIFTKCNYINFWTNNCCPYYKQNYNKKMYTTLHGDQKLLLLFQQLQLIPC
jgi:hypothetical protein